MAINTASKVSDRVVIPLDRFPTGEVRVFARGLDYGTTDRNNPLRPRVPRNKSIST